MRHKILIADDSLTIQKVIKITLANEPFDMEVCGQADELAAKVQALSPHIVLLDFNLSEEKTGYELCRRIKEINSNSKVFMLFGTFDTVDEDQLVEAGCDSKIVKPFDGTKFISICRSLADQASDNIANEEEEALPGIIENTQEEEEPEEDNWVMDAPEHVDATEEVVEDPVEISIKKSALDQEVEDWGMSVPGIIGGDDDQLDLPEVIDFSQSSESDRAEDDTTLPSSNDLEYPEPKEGPRLIPISDLHLTEDEELGDEELEEEEEEYFEEVMDLEVEGTDSEEALRKIEAQIQDELAEDETSVGDNSNLWSYDEIDQSSDLPEIKPHNLEEVKLDMNHESGGQEDENAMATPADFPDAVDYDSAKTSQPINFDSEFEEKLKEHLKPLVEDYVKQYSKAMIEKVAWEVIPDLAENLIRKEIKRISDTIISP